MISKLAGQYQGKIFYGGAPGLMSDLAFLQKEKIDIVWNLMAELPEILSIEKKLFREVQNHPIVDGEIPNLHRWKTDCHFIVDAVKRGKNLFIHCLEGRDRTGMALASLFICHDRLSPLVALNKAFQLCGGPRFLKQQQFINDYFK